MSYYYGKILDRVAYVMRSETTGKNLLGEEIKVRDTFPFNPESRTAPATAERWASPHLYNHLTKETVQSTAERIDRDNSPFHITVTDLAFRGNGGRAYKVVDDDGRRFDLREDQLLEVFRLKGIQPGGGVPGQFVWAQLGSQMHMVLVGGKLHEKLLVATVEEKAHKAKESAGLLFDATNMQPGHVYEKKDGYPWLFLGGVVAPGSDRVLSAMVKMPMCPHMWTDEQLSTMGGPNVARYRAQAEMAKKWDNMTWEQRCQWEWYDEPKFTYEENKDRRGPGDQPISSDYYDCPEEITLYSSPKFVKDLGETSQDFVAAVKSNADNKHKYINGNGADMSELEFERVNGPRPQIGYSYWNCLKSSEEHAQRAAAIEQTRMIYRDSLKWQVGQ